MEYRAKINPEFIEKKIVNFKPGDEWFLLELESENKLRYVWREKKTLSISNTYTIDSTEYKGKIIYGGLSDVGCYYFPIIKPNYKIDSAYLIVRHDPLNKEQSIIDLYKYKIKEYMEGVFPDSFREEGSPSKEAVEFIINLYSEVFSYLYKAIDDMGKQLDLSAAEMNRIYQIGELFGISPERSTLRQDWLRVLYSRIYDIYRNKGSSKAIKELYLESLDVAPMVYPESGLIRVLISSSEGTDRRLFEEMIPAGWMIDFYEVDPASSFRSYVVYDTPIIYYHNGVQVIINYSSIIKGGDPISDILASEKVNENPMVALKGGAFVIGRFQGYETGSGEFLVIKCGDIICGTTYVGEIR